jgi:Putative DNA-binding domain
MSSALLAQQQNDLLHAIFATRVDASSRGLAAYRANAHAIAERALQAAYPILVQLIGEENFTYLARDFWHQHPPQRGDLAQWGDQLPLFLAASDQLSDVPYLADVARIEWALHTCAGAADGSQDVESFALLTQHAPEEIYVTLAAGAQLLTSAYPAAAIAMAHLGHGTMDDAAQLLHTGVGQTALVWRQRFAPRLRVVRPAELGFTSAVCAGHSLAQALDAAHCDFDLRTWLSDAVHSGLLLGAVHLTAV